jgi:hypothetical protein
VIGPPSSVSVRSNDALADHQGQSRAVPDPDQGFRSHPGQGGYGSECGLFDGFGRPAEGDAAANVASQMGGVKQVVTLFEFINCKGYFTIFSTGLRSVRAAGLSGCGSAVAAVRRRPSPR